MRLLRKMGRRFTQMHADKDQRPLALPARASDQRPSASISVLNDERGQSIVVMLLLLVPLLVLVIGLVHDLGNVAAAQTIAQDAADLAVQDAAKQIDTAHYQATQEILLAPDALTVASWWVDYATGGQMQVLNLYVSTDGIDAAIVLEGQVTVRTRFLDVIGIPVIHRRVVAVARPRFGAQDEGD
jgi:hypothetical protein